MRKYTLVRANRFKNFPTPEGWQAGDWQEVSRDQIIYKMCMHIDALPDSIKNQADFNFDNLADYTAWLASTDIVATHLKTVAISNDKANPTYTRTATCLNQYIDYERNTMSLTLAIKSYNADVEQKQLYATKSVQVSEAFYGLYMGNLNTPGGILNIVETIIKQHDAEGVL